MLNRKKIIIGALAGLFTFMGLTNAQAPGITPPTFTITKGGVNTYNGITTSFNPYANFTSDTYQSKALFYNYNVSNPVRSATFWYEGKLYGVFWGLSSNVLIHQGYLYLCNIQSLDTKQFCRTYNNEGNPSLTDYYIEQYANPDYFQFYGYDYPHIGCFVYEDLGEKLCFGMNRDGNSGFENGGVQLFNSVPTGYDDPRFAQFAGDSYWSNSGGGETTTETTTILGQCPTVREILSTYGSEYNTGICYSATRLLTQTGIVNTTAKSIFQLYPTFTGWLADYNYYKQYCDNVPTSVCREAFSGNEIKWSLLNKTPQDNPIAIYQYCHLQLNIQDKNATTCVLSTGAYYATGVDEAIIDEIQGNQSVLDIMLNSFNNLKEELPSFSSGTVFDEFLEEGETRKDSFKLDIFKTFLELWSKITSIFIFRHQYDGIIPTYITSIIMIILLFKILKK